MKTATEFKHFFRDRFGIPVRVETAKKPYHYTNVWIKSVGDPRGPLRYDHEFPPDLGNRCLQIIYGADTKTGQQSWGGNVRPNMIAMHPHEWDELERQLNESHPEATGTAGDNDGVQSRPV